MEWGGGVGVKEEVVRRRKERWRDAKKNKVKGIRI